MAVSPQTAYDMRGLRPFINLLVPATPYALIVLTLFYCSGRIIEAIESK